MDGTVNFLIFLLLCLGLLTAEAHAQSTVEILRAAINAKHGDCAEVTSADGIAMVDNGDVLIGAICSNGDHWVLQMNEQLQMVRTLNCYGFRATGVHLPFCE